MRSFSATSVSIRFERTREGSTAFEVVDKRGTLLVVEMPPPQDVDPAARGWDETLRSWLLDVAPGRLASALRLSLSVES